MVAENNIRLEQTQKLVMTPELIQAIHLLQFNTQELADYIQEQIVSNPVLETEEDLGEKVENAEMKLLRRKKISKTGILGRKTEMRIPQNGEPRRIIFGNG